MKIDLSNADLYWEEIKGFASENDIDNRWKLRIKNDPRVYGQLRIVSHPDLKPGYLRSIYTTVTDIKPKTKDQIIKTIEDYQMEETELEVYSVNEEIKTETQIYEAPVRELEELFGIKVLR